MVQGLTSIAECLPEPDQFSSCTDLMRNQFLRIFMWILGISALVGNGFVIVWRIIPRKRQAGTKSASSEVQSTLVLNLALADGLMGVYMITIAAADMSYRGTYILYAEEWQKSIFCKLAGFMSVLSSETSVFFMTIISIDRFLNIVLPFSRVNLTPKTSKIAALIIWILTFFLSIMPFLIPSYFKSEFYCRSSVCLALPLSAERPAGWEYSVALFLCINLLAFTIICVSYLAIYITVKLSSGRVTSTRKSSSSQQIEFAMRMAFLVGTDFVCWMPIIVMGLLSLTEVVTIPAIIYVWCAVFFLPINSSLNPYLFTILTREMKKKASNASQGTNNQKNKTPTSVDDSWAVISHNGIINLLMYSDFKVHEDWGLGVTYFT